MIVLDWSWLFTRWILNCLHTSPLQTANLHQCTRSFWISTMLSLELSLIADADFTWWKFTWVILVLGIGSISARSCGELSSFPYVALSCVSMSDLSCRKFRFSSPASAFLWAEGPLPCSVLPSQPLWPPRFLRRTRCGVLLKYISVCFLSVQVLMHAIDMEVMAFSCL